MFICSLPGTPNGSWHYEFINFKAHLLQRLDENDGKPGAHFYKTRAPTSCQNFWEPSDGSLANFVRPQASLPRTIKNKPAYRCMPIINGKKIFLSTPKCYLQRSWASDPEDSKNKPMVQARERRADGKPSLVVGRGPTSWTMLSLMALTRQKQLAKLWQAASQPASQCYACLLQDCFSCWNIHSAETFSDFFWEQAGNGPTRNNSRKSNFILSDIYVRHWKHAFNECFEKRVRTDNLVNRLKCNWARISS
jgi:hypothetical protein